MINFTEYTIYHRKHLKSLCKQYGVFETLKHGNHLKEKHSCQGCEAGTCPDCLEEVDCSLDAQLWQHKTSMSKVCNLSHDDSRCMEDGSAQPLTLYLLARQPSGAPFGLCCLWRSRPNTGRSARWHCSSLDLQRSCSSQPNCCMAGMNAVGNEKFQVSCDVCQQQNATQWRKNPAAPKCAIEFV